MNNAPGIFEDDDGYLKLAPKLLEEPGYSKVNPKQMVGEYDQIYTTSSLIEEKPGAIAQAVRYDSDQSVSGDEAESVDQMGKLIDVS